MANYFFLKDMIGNSVKGVIKKEQKKERNEIVNSRDGLSVYGYIRQNFDQKCLIQGIIATIIQFYMKKGGFLWVCGDGDYGKLGIKEFYNRECMELTRVQSVKEIIDIAAFQNHTMMVDHEGRVWAFGNGYDGRLGTGNNENVTLPTQIQLNNRAIAVSVGSAHSLILFDEGNVSSCGGNRFGQLGHGNTERKFVPKIIEALRGHKIIQISSGTYHNGALSENGDLFMWGYNVNGQCGVGDGKGDKIKTPQMIKLNEKVSVIECGNNHSLLITTGSLLYSFGEGDKYKLGHGTNEDECTPKFVESLFLDINIINVAGGYEHTLCVGDKFSVWAFGGNLHGQCGHSTYIKCLTKPKEIEYFKTNNIKAKKVVASAYLSCVITHNNDCFVFGNNERYQLGLKWNGKYSVPQKLPLSVQKASMGLDHSAFIS